MSSSSLDKRIGYLGLADFDYLDARLLLLSGLALGGYAKASLAFEKICKLLLLLVEKINNNKGLSEKELRKYSHDLPLLLLEIEEIPGANISQELKDFFADLQRSYNLRYPENWKAFTLNTDLGKVDQAYKYFRNNVVDNMPLEDRKRARQFGTFIYDFYRGEVIKRIAGNGNLTPPEILKMRNSAFEDLNINHDYL
jgi:hypothetical protein